MAIYYRRVYTRIWDDPEFLALDNFGKAAWFYLLTSDQTNLIGLYRLSQNRMAEKFKVSGAECLAVLRTLEDAGFATYDPEAELCFVLKWLKYQPPQGPKQAKGYLNVVNELPKHRFTKAYHIALGPFLVGIENFQLKPKHIIAIRDGCRCVYCDKAFEDWLDIGLDKVVPDDRDSSFANLVAACKSCREKKGKMTAEEFGYPFTAGFPFTAGSAMATLVVNTELRKMFARASRGLPRIFMGAEKVEDILSKVRYSEDEFHIPSIGYGVSYGKGIETPPEGYDIPHTSPIDSCNSNSNRTSTRNRNRKTGGSGGGTEEDGGPGPSNGGKRAARQADPLAAAKAAASSMLAEKFPGCSNPTGLVRDLVLSYPDLNIASMIADARAWLDSPSSKRSDVKDANRFLRNWARNGEVYQKQRLGLLDTTKREATQASNADVEPQDAGAHLRELEKRSRRDQSR